MDNFVGDLTDLEKFTKMLDMWEVDFNEHYLSDGSYVIEVVSGINTPRVKGHTGSFCEWVFDRNGKFTEVGVWE